MALRFTDLIGDIVDSLRQRTSIVSITDLGSGIAEIEVSDVLDLADNKYIIIDGVEFKIIDGSFDSGTKKFRIQYASLPVGTELKTAYPFYYHGTPIAIDNELKQISDGFKKYPIIYLAERLSDIENLDPVQVIGDNYSCRFFFMKDADYVNSLTSDLYDEAIDPMNEIVDAFISKLRSNSFILRQSLNELERINHAKWGLFIQDKGAQRNIFTDNLSGVEVSIQVPVRKTFNPCRYKDIDFRNCAGVTIYNAGVYEQTVASGGRFDYTSAGGNGTADLYDSDGNLISSTNIPAGTIQNILAPDGLVKNSDNSYLDNVLSNGELILPDITFTDTDGTTSSVPSVNNVSATLIPNLSCAQLNDVDDGLTASQRQVIQMVEPLKTGQTTSYRTGDDGDLEKGRLVDFFTLSCNNPFGNTNRFTDQSGGQTYSDNIVVDWATRRMWYRVLQTAVVWNSAIDLSLAATTGGYSWWLPNDFELYTLKNSNNSIVVNYSPLNLSILSTDLLWTSTTQPSNTANVFCLIGDGRVGLSSKASSRQYIYCRQFTYSGGSFS